MCRLSDKFEVSRRIVLSTGDRSVVFGALKWRQVENRLPEKDMGDVQRMWSPTGRDVQSKITRDAGFTLEDLSLTASLLMCDLVAVATHLGLLRKTPESVVVRGVNVPMAAEEISAATRVVLAAMNALTSTEGGDP